MCIKNIKLVIHMLKTQKETNKLSEIWTWRQIFKNLS